MPGPLAPVEPGEAPVKAGAAAASPPLRAAQRPFEVPMNMWGFLALGLWAGATGVPPAAPSLCLMLGLFTIWTETALLERRLGMLSRLLDRKVRPDDPLPFAGAIFGVVIAALASPSTSAVRGAAVPIAMIAGSFAVTFVSGLDWRRSLLSAILVVYNGTGGAILRTAMTLAVWGNILRGSGA